MSEIDLSEVKNALIAAGITGEHRSHARESSIRKIHALLASDDDDATFGLTGSDRYNAFEVLSFMAELTGCSPDVEDVACGDLIDPDKTMSGLVAVGHLLKAAAARGDSLLVATGHPTGMLEFYIRVLDAYVAAGGKAIRLREEEKLPIGSRGRAREVRYVGGVGCLADWGSLIHTHSSAAMEALLDHRPWPDLVLADHGFAGAAIERGIPTIAIMDINDHALAIAKAEGREVEILPLDDNRPPALYEPAWRLVEHRLRS